MVYWAKPVTGATLKEVVNEANKVARLADYVMGFTTPQKVDTYVEETGELFAGYVMAVHYCVSEGSKNRRRLTIAQGPTYEDVVEMGNRFLDSDTSDSPFPYELWDANYCHLMDENGEETEGFWYALIEYEHKAKGLTAKVKAPLEQKVEDSDAAPADLEGIVSEVKDPSRWEKFQNWYKSTGLYQRMFKSKDDVEEEADDVEYKLPAKRVRIKMPVTYKPFTREWFSAGIEGRKIRFSNWRGRVSQKYQDWKLERAAKKEDVENPGPSLAPEDDITPFGFTDLAAPPTEGMQPEVYMDNDYAGQTVEAGYEPAVQEEFVAASDTPVRKVKESDVPVRQPTSVPPEAQPAKPERKKKKKKKSNGFPQVPEPPEQVYSNAPEPTPMYEPEPKPEKEPSSDLPKGFKFVPAKPITREEEEADEKKKPK